MHVNVNSTVAVASKSKSIIVTRKHFDPTHICISYNLDNLQKLLWRSDPKNLKGLLSSFECNSCIESHIAGYWFHIRIDYVKVNKVMYESPRSGCLHQTPPYLYKKRILFGNLRSEFLAKKLIIKNMGTKNNDSLWVSFIT